MNSVFKIIIGVFILTVVSAQSARAATFNLNFNEPLSVVAMPTADSTTGTVLQGLTVSDPNLYYASPWAGTANYGATYTAVGKGATASYEFDTDLTQISFLWGSVDKFNTVLFLKDGDVVDYLTGSNAISDGAPDASGFVQITILAALFDEVVFQSSGDSFEYANLNVSAVPLPAALPLYAAGVLLLGWVGRKRRV